MNVRYLVLIAALALGVAGCGSSADHSTMHNPRAVQSCLHAQGLAVDADLGNAYAPSSRDFVIRFNGPDVYLIFAATQKAAGEIEQNVRDAAAVLESNADDVVRRDGNLVYYSTGQSFPAGAADRIDRCVNPPGEAE